MAKPSNQENDVHIEIIAPPSPQLHDSSEEKDDVNTQEVENIIEDVYKSVSAHRTTESKDHVVDTEDKLTANFGLAHDVYEKLNNYCTKYAKIFDSSINVLTSQLDLRSFESTYVEVSKVLVDGLGLLGDLHPVVGVAVSPLKLILAYDLNRRQNDKKVTAVKMQILDTATVLFRLRSFRGPQLEGPDGLPLRDLADLMKKIATDIRECASACDLYLDKNAFVKIVRSKEYQDRFAQFMKKLKDDQRALTMTLTTYTAVGIGTANEKLDEQREDLKIIKTQMEAVFRKLDTPRERAAQTLIAKKGSAKACVESDTAFPELVEISGESFQSLVPAGSRIRTEPKLMMEDARKALIEELAEDVNKEFDKHMEDFNRKLKAQQQQLNQISEDIHSTSEHVITTVIDVLSGGVQAEIENEHLKKLWEKRGWKSSVHAHELVLALKEYFAFEYYGPTEREVHPDAESRPNSPVPGEHPEAEKYQGDAWALAYINVAHIQPLLDVIDTDGTQYISISEANHFARLQPGGDWSLLRWFAFWAAGWQLTVMWYRNKLYTFLREMLDLLHRVKPANVRAADSYFAGEGIQRVELLLRATQPAEFENHDVQLTKLAKQFNELEEGRINSQLEELRYKLDNIDTLRLVTGAQSSGLRRIEVHLYPLLHQLLMRHLTIMQLACIHTLHEDEFSAMSVSLATVFEAVDHRTQKLAEMFRSNAKNDMEGFSSFAFGMFEHLYRGPHERDANQNTICKPPKDEADYQESPGNLSLQSDGERASFEGINPCILLYGIQEEPRQLHDPEPPQLLPELSTSDPIHGLWEGNFYFPNDDTPWGKISMQLTRYGDDFTGVMENFMGLLNVVGKIENKNIEFTVTWPTEYGCYSIVCKGPYYPVWTGTITGLWRQRTDNDEDERQNSSATTNPLRFAFHRPRPSEDKSSSRWEKVIDAMTRVIGPDILRKARARDVARKQWFWLIERLDQRKRFIDLMKRSMADWDDASTIWRPLDEQEIHELDTLLLQLRPCDARVYATLARSELRRLVFHARWCDSCNKCILGPRRFCVQCMDDQYYDCIDLCSRCHEHALAVPRGFTHKPAHLLVKTVRRIHDADAAWMVPQAKEVAQRVKRRSKAADAPRSHLGGPPQPSSYPLTQKTQTQALQCCCCEKPVSHPFWACIECCKLWPLIPDDPIVCMDCDAKSIAAKPDGLHPQHRPLHVVVQLWNSESIPTPQVSDLTFKGVMTRLSEMEAKMDKKLEDLTSLVQEILGKQQTQTVIVHAPTILSSEGDNASVGSD